MRDYENCKNDEKTWKQRQKERGGGGWGASINKSPFPILSYSRDTYIYK